MTVKLDQTLQLISDVIQSSETSEKGFGELPQSMLKSFSFGCTNSPFFHHWSYHCEDQSCEPFYEEYFMSWLYMNLTNKEVTEEESFDKSNTEFNHFCSFLKPYLHPQFTNENSIELNPYWRERW